MGRTVSANLLAEIASGSPSLSYCALFTRKDGATIGFTTNSDPFTFSSIYYNVFDSIDPAPIKAIVGTAPDNVELKGLLSSTLIQAQDVVNGLYNDCVIEIFIVSYVNLTWGKMTMFKGDIVSFDLKDDVFIFENQALSGRMKQNQGDETSLTCRVAKFCDNQCKLTLATYTHASSVFSVTDAITITFNDASATGFYRFGSWVTFTSGVLNGLTREIKSHTLVGGKAQIILRDPVPQLPSASDTCNIIQGCDHEWSTCKLLGNAVNFRGEPHLPGNLQLITAGVAPTPTRTRS